MYNNYHKKEEVDLVKILVGLFLSVIALSALASHVENSEVTVYNCTVTATMEQYKYLYSAEKESLSRGMEVECIKLVLPNQTVWTLRSR